MTRRIRRPLYSEPPVIHGENPERDRSGRFLPGNSVGRENRGQAERGEIRRAIRRSVTADDYDAVVTRIMRAAKNGSVQAASWIADRLDGRPRNEPEDTNAPIEIPDLEDLESCAKAQRAVTRSAARGEITLAQGERLSALVAATADRLRDVDLEARITELERVKPTTKRDLHD